MARGSSTLDPKLPFNDQLAFERTRLAAERTMLAYVRTAIGFAGGGVGLMLLRHQALLVVGVLTISLGVLVAGYGLIRHRIAVGALRTSAREHIGGASGSHPPTREASGSHPPTREA